MPFKHAVPGSSPGGSNIWGHSSMVEHEVSSNPCRRNQTGVDHPGFNRFPRRDLTTLLAKISAADWQA